MFWEEGWERLLFVRRRFIHLALENVYAIDAARV
jgi:hypothetical protein